MKKIRNILTLALSGLFLAGFLLAAILTPDRTDSLSERRKLAQRPALRASAVADGTYMTAFEKYSLDQFPLRDSFRRLKAVTLLDVLQEKDNNGIYLADGYAAKLDPSIDEASVQHAADRFQLVYDRYLAGTDAKVFAAVIPDKNAFLARQNGYPAYDPAELSALLAQSMPYASMIDLTPALSLDSYYHTDLHWRQEALLPVARTLAEATPAGLKRDFDTYAQTMHAAITQPDGMLRPGIEGGPEAGLVRILTARAACRRVFPLGKRMAQQNLSCACRTRKSSCGWLRPCSSFAAWALARAGIRRFCIRTMAAKRSSIRQTRCAANATSSSGAQEQPW